MCIGGLSVFEVSGWGGVWLGMCVVVWVWVGCVGGVCVWVGCVCGVWEVSGWER